MTQSELKRVASIGAELGAAKAENERLRTALKDLIGLAEDQICQHHNTHRGGAIWEICDDCGMKWADDMGGRPEFMWPDEIESARTALSQQAEPTDAFTAVDMATAAAQGFRDGQAAVEQAAVQDELWAVHAQGPDELYAAFSREDAEQHAAALNALPMPAGIQVSAVVIASPWSAAEHWKYLAEQEREHAAELKARAAQTEQATVKECLTVQPMAYAVFAANGNVVCFSTRRDHPSLVALESDGHSVVSLAPIAQAAPQGKFRMGDLVKKSTGSEWQGRIVGTYSTELTPEGYAVESEAHKGSVQIYPAKALEAVE